MTACTQCGAQAQLFGCTRCQNELRAWLNGLAYGTAVNFSTGETRSCPGYLERLQEAMHGQTRLGESARRSTDKGSPALCKLGPKGSFRGSPGQLMVYTHSVLVEWTRDICETRGVPTPREPATRALALWLAHNVSAIASDQGFAVCYREVKQIVRDIERAINRPNPPVLLGPCPTMIAHHRACAVRLSAPRGAATVKCQACGYEHDVETVIEKSLESERAADYTATVPELAVLLRRPVRTIYDWVNFGKLKPANSIGPARYRLADARELSKPTERKQA